MSDAEKLTAKLEAAGAVRSHVIKIIDSYGDPIEWGADTLEEIIGSVWDSDINSGEEPENWIINEICRTFNVTEVTE